MGTKIKMVLFGLLFIIFIINNIGGSMEGHKIHYESLNEVPIVVWEKLSAKKIFFGHQSVGHNIIDGINDLMKENKNIQLSIREADSIHNINGGVFAHAMIGENRKPESKFNSFANIVNAFADKSTEQSFDFAFVKCCFVDVDEHTDIEILFNNYKDNIKQIKEKKPHIKIIHFTVPLETTKVPFSFWLKIFKSAGWSYRLKMIKNFNQRYRYEENIKRNEYNNLIRNKYKEGDILFDIASIESTYPDGKRETFKKNDKTYYSLVPEYTDDGGHLNKKGKRRVAEQFLLLLANQC